MTTKVINVSPSVLADVISCESKSWWRHIKGYTSRSEAIKAAAGQGVHIAMATLFDPKLTAIHGPSTITSLALEEFHKLYDPVYARLSADKLEPALVPANLHRVVARWIEMHPAPLLPWKSVKLVEEAFCSREWVAGDTTVRLIVRPDLVVEDFEGKIRYVDTKTTGWRISDASWRNQLKLSLQTNLYADAVVQKFGADALYGGWISALELRQLPSDPNRKCATHKVVYAECGNEHCKAEFIECLTTPEQVQARLMDAEKAARRFVEMVEIDDAYQAEFNNPRGQTGPATPPTLSMNTHGASNGSCRFCPGAEWCLVQRPASVEALQSYFVYEPWLVEEGRRK